MSWLNKLLTLLVATFVVYLISLSYASFVLLREYLT